MPRQEDLQKLVEWRPIAPGFGCDGDFHAKVIVPLIGSLQALPDAQVLSIASGKGGLSNYAAVFVHDRGTNSGKIDGLHICLSLLSPFAAMGRDTVFISETSFGYSGLEPEALLVSTRLASNLERAVFSLVETAGFHLLSPEEAKQPLPEGIAPYEYCLGKEPWDRLFHVLFSDTD